MRRERSVGGTAHLALPPAERRPYQVDFAKCGGGRRVVEAPPRWRLSIKSRRARRGEVERSSFYPWHFLAKLCYNVPRIKRN